MQCQVEMRGRAQQRPPGFTNCNRKQFLTVTPIFEILTVRSVKRVKLCHRAKFRGDWSNRGGDMVIFQDVVHCHVGFLNFWILNCRSGQEGKTASLYQILWRSVKPLHIYGDFSIF